MSKRLKPWPADTQEGRGKMAEERFFKAWTKNLPKWIISIERPTLAEDLFQKTDAVIICLGRTSNIKIQIKSYPMSEDHRLELMAQGVVPVWLIFNESYKEVRMHTLNAIRKFDRFLEENKPKKNKVAPQKQNTADSFYRGGRKFSERKKK